jgi:hypothetical protein
LQRTEGTVVVGAYEPATQTASPLTATEQTSAVELDNARQRQRDILGIVATAVAAERQEGARAPGKEQTPPPKEDDLPKPGEVPLAELLRDMTYAYTVYDNPHVRQLIEARLAPMDLSHLLMFGWVSQSVPLMKKPDSDSFRVVITFRSLLADEVDELQAYSFRKYPTPGTEFDRENLYNKQRLLGQINKLEIEGTTRISRPSGTLVPESLDVNILSSLPEDLRKMLFANLRWFNSRVTRLMGSDLQELINF